MNHINTSISINVIIVRPISGLRCRMPHYSYEGPAQASALHRSRQILAHPLLQTFHPNPPLGIPSFAHLPARSFTFRENQAVFPKLIIHPPISCQPDLSLELFHRLYILAQLPTLTGEEVVYLPIGDCIACDISRSGVPVGVAVGVGEEDIGCEDTYVGGGGNCYCIIVGS